MLHALPIIGWAIQAVFTLSISVIFWLGWTVFGVGYDFFYFLPERFQSLSFWEVFWLFTVVGILKSVFTPRFVSVSQTNN